MAAWDDWSPRSDKLKISQVNLQLILTENVSQCVHCNLKIYSKCSVTFLLPPLPQVNLFLSNVQRKVYHKEVIFAFIFNICFIEWMRSWDILESLERLSRKFFESDLINWKELLVISKIFSCLVIDQHNSNI